MVKISGNPFKKPDDSAKAKAERHTKRIRAYKGALYTYEPNEQNLPKGYKRVYGNRERGGANTGEKNSFLYDIFYNDRTQEYMVSFKGSKTALEWYHNIKGTVTPARPLTKGNVRGKIQSGFADAYEALYDELMSDVAKIPKSAKINFSGHSLGGAVAQLAAADMHNNGYHVKNLTTFGSPTAGDKEFMRRYPKFETNTRVVNPGDPVTVRRPGLFHVGRRFENKKKGESRGVLRTLSEILSKSTGGIFGGMDRMKRAHGEYDYTPVEEQAAEEVAMGTALDE